jgi:pimeloyl-ACP methyl ester carboxylesterase
MTGYGALFVGGIGIIMPLLPGVIFIILGLSILSAHSRFAHEYLAKIRARHPNFTQQLTRLETWLIHNLNLATHSHEYVDIPARNERILHLLVERSHIPETGVALILHGASGTKETAVTSALAEVLRAQGHTVIRLDAHNGLGEGDGSYTLFTASNYREDLEDALAWVREQEWQCERLILAGHSVGGLVVGMYAQEHPEHVQELYLFAPTVSGPSLQHAYETHAPDILEKWRVDGLRQTIHPLTRETHGLGVSFLDDILQYDLLPKATQLTMPVHIVSGANDTISVPGDCKTLATAIGAHATYTILSGLTHNPTDHHDLRLLRDAFITTNTMHA